jgi:hypothetical protein
MVRRRKPVTPEERACRRIVSERSGGVCEVCGGARATNKHHRVKAGRVWRPSNVLDVCGSGTTGCHGRIESYPDASKEQGWWLLPVQDPARAPVWIFGRGFVFLSDTGEIHDVEDEVA